MTTYKELINTPIKERPVSLAPPWNKDYFTGVALLLISLPLIVSVINCLLAIMILGNFVPLLPTLIGSGFLFGAHGAVCSGISSSGQATYCKESEPLRFWLGASVCYLVFIVCMLLTWAIN
jgi:hypothetical protein